MDSCTACTHGIITRNLIIYITSMNDIEYVRHDVDRLGGCGGGGRRLLKDIGGPSRLAVDDVISRLHLELVIAPLQYTRVGIVLQAANALMCPPWRDTAKITLETGEINMRRRCGRIDRSIHIGLHKL